MKQNRKWLLILSIVLSVAIAAGGTMAYLQDTDEDVNVMTLGKVEIRQHEYERVQNADGTYATIETESGIGYKLKDFSQDKPLFPAVGDYRVMDDTLVYFDQLGENAGGEAGVAGQLENVQDKFVVVENTGKSDAYVRTLFAFEGTDALTEYLGLGITEDWAWNDPKLEIVVDGATYVVMEAVYVGSADRHADGILPAGEWTPSSLSQVFLAPEATNEVVEGLDTNKNGKYDILVLSQAVQVQGFEGLGADGKSDAQNALDTAFGLVNEENSTEWFNGVYARYKQQSEEDHWDGTVDTSWYNDTDTEFVLTTAEQLAGFGKLVDEGNTFDGKTVKLGQNICIGCETGECATKENGEKLSFNPIGYGYDVVFKGTFDGQNNTIANLYQNGWDLGYDYSTEAGGLFASVVDADIKNLTIDGAEIAMECIDMGVLVGYSYGNCNYENITVKNSSIANYQRYTGGVVGEVNGTQSFKNVDVIDTTIASMWGDFDCSLGGIIGGKYGEANITMEDCDVECVIDAQNDVVSAYQWHAYRRAGMLIGNSEEVTNVDGTNYATASYLNAKNCTVTYDDWAEYTYCEFAGTSYPYVRVQAGLHNNAYSNARYGHPTDANGNTVVDDNHVHNEGEDHFILCEFDQLFGGGQGVYGTASHDGVTVVYNHK